MALLVDVCTILSMVLERMFLEDIKLLEDVFQYHELPSLSVNWDIHQDATVCSHFAYDNHVSSRDSFVYALK